MSSTIEAFYYRLPFVKQYLFKENMLERTKACQLIYVIFSNQYNSYELIISIKFQIIVGSCSALIKEESENPKLAENLTVYLPDFSSGAIKSLLCLMYTGSLLYHLLY